MMKYKFRAWDKSRNKFVTDFVIAPTSPNWSAHILRGSHDDRLDNLINTSYYADQLPGSFALLDWSDYYGIDNYIIQQFTGLYDCEGLEIYEGDIIEIPHYNWKEPYGATGYYDRHDNIKCYIELDVIKGLSLKLIYPKVKHILLVPDLIFALYDDYKHLAYHKTLKIIGNFL